MRLRLAVGLVAVAAVLPLAAGALRAQEPPSGGGGGLGIRLVDAPVDRREDPRALIYVVDHVRPGTTISRRIEAHNRSQKPLDVQLYAASADVRGGAFVVGEGRAANELTEWTRVEPSMATMPAGARVTATVTIRVPEDASPGERYGAALVEVPPAPQPGGGVALGARVGVRIYLSVGPGGEPASDFEIESLQARRLPDGTPQVDARVRNTGGRALDLAGDLRLSEGPSGLGAGPFPVEVQSTLAPGETVPVNVALDRQVPAGPWRARITLRSGRVERQAEAVLSFPAAAGTSARPVRASEVTGTTGGRIALAIAVGLLVLIAAAALVTLRRRRLLPRDRVRSESGG